MNNSGQLAERYQGMNSDDLLDLHQSGKLSDVAYDVIENELRSRNLTFGERPEEFDGTSSKPPRQPFFASHFRGKRSLASAYWLIGVLGTFVALFLNLLLIVVLVFVSTSLHIETGRVTEQMVWIPLVVYQLYATICIVNCSKNARSRFWAVVAQVVAILSFLKLFTAVLNGPLA